MDWSYQLYSSRNHTPWPDVLKGLAKAGYKRVEGFGAVYDDPKGFRAELKKNGLTMPTAHFSIELLEKDFAKVESVAKALGVKLIVCPYLVPEARPKSRKGWEQFVARLGKIAKQSANAGFDFAWHNHDFEFRLLPDGSSPMRHILDGSPTIGWEIDVAWIIRGGIDPAPWIAAYGPRIAAVHVKDIATAGTNIEQDGWSDVGHGEVDWKGLYKLLRSKTKARHYIMEHDNPPDAARFAKRSIATVRKF
ncbi:MAG: sugar phosphate isomerase/epimerase [Rhizobiaceae bacterium]|nr:sugar phosphate isomerase/epimerase [Rhizobiaceae bacterium]